MNPPTFAAMPAGVANITSRSHVFGLPIHECDWMPRDEGTHIVTGFHCPFCLGRVTAEGRDATKPGSDPMLPRELQTAA